MTISDPAKISKIVVLGGGTAGLLTALALHQKLGERAQVLVIRSKKIGVIGVGEGTIPSVVSFLHHYLDIDPERFHREVRPSLKLGIRYLWGTRPQFNYTFAYQLTPGHETLDIARGYLCDDNFDYAEIHSALMHYDRVALRRPDGKPRPVQSFAYHLENKSFVAFLERLSDERGIEKWDDQVIATERGSQGVEKLKLESGREVTADLFVDCSGFQSRLLHQTLDVPFQSFGDTLWCDRAIVGGWERTDEIYHPHTTAETMSAGWCWRIEHDEVINRGYVFSRQFQKEEDAIEEFLRINPQIKNPRGVDFIPGVYERTWVDNVVAVGNAAGFVEPLEATAIGIICDAIVHLVRALNSSGLRHSQRQREIFNRLEQENWELIRDFLAIHYRFNGRYNTPFWQAARADTPLGQAAAYVDYFQEIGPDFSLLTNDLKRDFFTSDGYLVMLVGQQVPYANRLPADDPRRAKWAMYRAQVATAAQCGVTMSEYLAAARSGALFADTEQTRGRRNHANGSQPGELNWH